MPSNNGNKAYEWNYYSKLMPLSFEWKIARDSITEKENIFLELKSEGKVVISECTPNKRYGESIEAILSELKGCANIFSLESKSKFACLRSAIQYCRLMHTERFSKVPSLQSCFSIPIMEPGELKAYLETFGKNFSFYKMKVAGEASLELIHEFYKIKDVPILIDGNEGFNSADEVLKMLGQLSAYPIEYIEQPLPAQNVEEQRKFFEKSPIPIFADESCLNDTRVDELVGLFHGINVKLMKSTPLRALAQLERARDLGLKTMVGCMVESSIGISMVMKLGLVADYYDLDGWLFFKDEPFKLIERKLDCFNLR